MLRLNTGKTLLLRPHKIPSLWDQIQHNPSFQCSYAHLVYSTEMSLIFLTYILSVEFTDGWCLLCITVHVLSECLLSPVEDGVSRRAHLPVRPGNDVHPGSGGAGRLSCSQNWPGSAEVCT